MPEHIVVGWLWRTFSSFGKVYDAFIPASSRKGRGFCFGFVRFGDMETAKKIVVNTNNCDTGGRNLVVKVATFG